MAKERKWTLWDLGGFLLSTVGGGGLTAIGVFPFIILHFETSHMLAAFLGGLLGAIFGRAASRLSSFRYCLVAALSCVIGIGSFFVYEHFKMANQPPDGWEGSIELMLLQLTYAVLWVCIGFLIELGATTRFFGVFLGEDGSKIPEND